MGQTLELLFLNKLSLYIYIYILHTSYPSEAWSSATLLRSRSYFDQLYLNPNLIKLQGQISYVYIHICEYKTGLFRFNGILARGMAADEILINLAQT